jgi:hypothetical protein
VQFASQGGSFFLVQDGKVSGDISSDSFNFGEFSSTS